MKSELILVGNGMAGAKLLEELTATCTELFNITVFGNEPYGNYNRIMLSPLLAGDKNLDEIMLNGRDWYEANNIKLNTGPDNAIVYIDRAKRHVITASGSVCHYDRLIIATGAQPFILPIPGNELEGVMSFRDIKDVEKMIAASRQFKKAVVVGAGLLGLEAAMGLMRRGMDVTVVHSNAIPLNRQLDQEAGEILQAELTAKGLHFKMNARTSALLEGDRNQAGRISQVSFSDGSTLETDIVVMAVGIRPNIELAKKAQLYCEKGIVVSDTLQTYDPRIYALGECIQHRGDTFGLVAPLYDQAKVLSNHLSEHGVAKYYSLPSATKLKVTGINLFSVGNFLDSNNNRAIIFRDQAQGIYKKLVLKDDRLIGAVLYGDTQEGGFYTELIESTEDIEEIRPYLMFGRALCDEIRVQKKAKNATSSNEGML